MVTDFPYPQINRLKIHPFKSKVAELPKIKKVHCSKTLQYLAADLCLSITFHDVKELAALQKINGNSEVYEGLIIDTKSGKVIKDSQISLTIEDGQTFVSFQN